MTKDEILSKLKSGDLEGVDLTKVSLKKEDLSGGRFKGAKMPRASFRKSKLVGADLSGADLSMADLADTDLSGANLQGANLTSATLKNAVLTGANLSGIQAKDAVFTGAQLENANFQKADLTEAAIDKTNLENASFENAILNLADGTDSELVNVDFNGADLTECCFQNCRIEKVKAENIKGQAADFSLSSISETSFTKSQLEEADFANTLLEQVDFSGADLKNGLFNVSEQKDVNFAQANIDGASFKSVSGYTEAQVMEFKERGAKVDLFLIRRFFRLLRDSTMAKVIAISVIAVVGLGLYFFMANPNNWSFEKLDRVAQAAKGKKDYNYAIKLYEIMARKYAINHIKVSHAKNQIGGLLSLKGEYEDSDAIFKEVLKEYPDLENAVVMGKIGMADNMKARKEFEKAIAAYSEVAEKFPDFPQAVEAQEKIAKIYVAQGQVDKAREIYERIKQKYAQDARAVVHADFDIVDLLRNQGKNEQALAKLQDIYEANAADEYIGARSLSFILQVLVGMDKLDEALETLKTLKQQYPNDFNSYLDGELFIANALSSKKRFKEAEERYKMVYNDYKEYVQSMWAGSSWAELMVANKRYDEADKLLDELIAVWGKQEQYLAQFEMSKIRLLKAKKQYDQAIARCKKLLSTIKNDEYIVSANLLLAELYMDAGKYAEGEKVYLQVMASNKDKPISFTSSLLGLAKLYEAKGELKKAIARFQEVEKKSKDDVVKLDAQYSQLRIYRRLNDVKNEEKILKEMLETHKASRERTILIQMSMVDTYRRLKRFDEAIAILTPISQMDSKSHALNALTALVRIYSDMGEIQKAEKANEEIAKRFPDSKQASFDAALDTANLLVQVGKTDEAIERFKQIMEKGGKSHRARAMGGLLHIYIGQQQMTKATELFEVIKKELPVDSEIRVNAQLGMANLYRNRKQYDTAEKLYNEVLAKYKGKLQGAWALASLAQTLVEQQKFDGAIAYYNRLLKEYAKMPEQKVIGYLGLGAIEEQRRRFPQALAQYEKAVQVAKDPTDILNAKGSIVRLKAELGELDEAKKLYAGLKSEYPTKTAALESVEFSIAGAYVKNKDFKSAIQVFERIRSNTKNNTNWGNATLSLANAYLNSGKYEQSLAEFQKVLQRYKDNLIFQRNAQVGIAQIYLNKRDYGKAIVQLEKVLTNFKDKNVRAQALSSLSRIYFDQGKIDKAKETYMRLEKEAQEDPASRYQLNIGLAEIARKQGNDEEAIARYEKAFETAPEDSQKIAAMSSIALIYSTQGKFEQARKSYQRIQKEFAKNKNLVVDARMGEASILQQNQKYDEALAIYQDVAKTATDDNVKARAQVSVAQIQMMRQDFAGAEKTYNDVVKNYKQITSVVLDAKNGLASLYASRGEQGKALAIYDEIAKNSADENMRSWAHFSRAKIMAEQGQLDQAERVFQEIVKDPKFTPATRFQAQMGLAEILRKKNNPQGALAIYNKLATKSMAESDKIAALTAIAAIHVDFKQYDQAQKAYQTIIAQFPQNQSAQIDAKLGLANSLKEAKSYEQATKEYQDIITNYADAAQTYWAYMGMAQIQATTGQIDEAAKTYKTISDKYPESRAMIADAKLNMANMLKNANRRADAFKAYDEIIKQYPKNMHAVWALQGKAQMYAEMNDYDKANGAYDKIINSNLASANSKQDAMLGKAGLLSMSGQTKKAIDMYESLLPKLDKNKALQARSAIAYSYLSLQEPAKAGAQFEQILKDYPKNNSAVLDATMGLGEVDISKSDFAKAAQRFEQVAKKSGSHPRASTALQNLARARIMQGNFAAVDEVVKMLEKNFPDDANGIINVRMNAANQLRQEQRYDEALAQLNPVIKKYPGLPQTAWAEHSKGQVLTAMKRYDEARALYENIMKSYSTNQTAVVDAQLNLGQIDLYTNNLAEAKKVFENIATNYPEFVQSITALFNLAQIYEKQLDDRSLEATYNKILDRYRSNMTAFQNANMGLGNMYMRQRKFANAVSAFKQIYDKYPDSIQAAWAMAGAARGYINIGDQVSAEELLKKIIEKFPNEKEVVAGAKTTLEELYKR